MGIRTWNVRAHLNAGSVYLGQVFEDSEELARSIYHIADATPPRSQSLH